MSYLPLISLAFIILSTVLYFSDKLIRRRTVPAIILSVTLLKLLLVVLNDYMVFIPHKPDTVFYYESTMELFRAENWNQVWRLYASKGGPSSIGINLYITVSYILFWMFGTNPLVMPFANIALYSYMAIFMIRMAEKSLSPLYSSSAIIKLVALLIMFYPAGFSISVYNLRDPMLVICFVIFVLQLLHYGKRCYSKPSFYITMFLVVILRPLFVVVVAAILLLQFIFFNYKNNKRVFFYLLGSLSLVTYIVYDYINRFFNIDTVLYSIGQYAKTLEKAYPFNQSYSSLGELIAYLPIKFFYFMYYPFPWQSQSLDYFIPFFDSLLHIFLTLLTIVGIWLMYKKRRKIRSKTKKQFLFQLAVIFAGFVFLSIGEVQFDGAIRHRLPFTLLWIFALGTFYSVYLKSRKGRLIKFQYEKVAYDKHTHSDG